MSRPLEPKSLANMTAGNVWTDNQGRTHTGAHLRKEETPAGEACTNTTANENTYVILKWPEQVESITTCLPFCIKEIEAQKPAIDVKVRILASKSLEKNQFPTFKEQHGVFPRTPAVSVHFVLCNVRRSSDHTCDVVAYKELSRNLMKKKIHTRIQSKTANSDALLNTIEQTQEASKQVCSNGMQQSQSENPLSYSATGLSLPVIDYPPASERRVVDCLVDTCCDETLDTTQGESATNIWESCYPSGYFRRSISKGVSTNLQGAGFDSMESARHNVMTESGSASAQQHSAPSHANASSRTHNMQQPRIHDVFLSKQCESKRVPIALSSAKYQRLKTPCGDQKQLAGSVAQSKSGRTLSLHHTAQSSLEPSSPLHARALYSSFEDNCLDVLMGDKLSSCCSMQYSRGDKVQYNAFSKRCSSPLRPTLTSREQEKTHDFTRFMGSSEVLSVEAKHARSMPQALRYSIKSGQQYEPPTKLDSQCTGNVFRVEAEKLSNLYAKMEQAPPQCNLQGCKAVFLPQKVRLETLTAKSHVPVKFKVLRHRIENVEKPSSRPYRATSSVMSNAQAQPLLPKCVRRFRVIQQQQQRKDDETRRLLAFKPPTQKRHVATSKSTSRRIYMPLQFPKLKERVGGFEDTHSVQGFSISPPHQLFRLESKASDSSIITCNYSQKRTYVPFKPRGSVREVPELLPLNKILKISMFACRIASEASRRVASRRACLQDTAAKDATLPKVLPRDVSLTNRSSSMDKSDVRRQTRGAISENCDDLFWCSSVRGEDQTLQENSGT